LDGISGCGGKGEHGHLGIRSEESDTSIHKESDSAILFLNPMFPRSYPTKGVAIGTTAREKVGDRAEGPAVPPGTILPSWFGLVVSCCSMLLDV
jgi:hypothetical protein